MPVVAIHNPPSAPLFYSPRYSLKISSKRDRTQRQAIWPQVSSNTPHILLPTCSWFWTRTICCRRLLVLLTVGLGKAHCAVALAGKILHRRRQLICRKEQTPKEHVWTLCPPTSWPSCKGGLFGLNPCFGMGILSIFFYHSVHKKRCGKIRQEIKMQSILRYSMLLCKLALSWK